MPRLRRLSGPEVASTFQRFGFFVLSQRGSHIKLRRITQAGEKQTLTVPNHRELDTNYARSSTLTEAQPERHALKPAASLLP
jgi:predicted RNA binding protein YcfA (HicA-like mRNA interferase family)